MLRGNQENISGQITNPDKLEIRHISCSNCLKLLAEYAITNTKTQKKSKIIVKCPHCGDKSYIEEVNGDFYLGPAEDLIFVDTEYNKDIHTFITMKRK